MRKSISRRVLVPVALLMVVQAFPQICDTLAKQFPGAVIMRSEKRATQIGETRTGCIALMGPAEMFTAPKLIDASGNHERIFGREAIAYWYVRGNDTTYYLNGGRDLKTYHWIYLRRLVKGPMELYHFDVRGLAFAFQITRYDYYYFRLNGEWLDRRPVVWNEGGKRERLNRIFAHCPSVLALIASTKDLNLPDQASEFVRLYNTTCVAGLP